MALRCAVDIGATRTMFALIREEAPEIIASARPLTDVLFTGRRSPGRALAAALQGFIGEQGVRTQELLGVGVGVPGIVDRQQGTVLSCPNLRVLDGADLGAIASQDLGVPVYVENNTNLIALGEHTAGTGRDVEDLAVVFVGSGVGCGLILRGALYTGADGAASEFGHTIVVRNGVPCTCGAHGCLEMYCSGKALTRMAAQTFSPRELYALDTRFGGAQLLIEQAQRGHARAVLALEEAFAYLGIGLTSLANVLNPRMIVLGGGIVGAWPQGVERARQIVMAEALPEIRRNLRIELSQLQNHAGVLGGAALVSAGGDVIGCA